MLHLAVYCEHCCFGKDRFQNRILYFSQRTCAKEQKKYENIFEFCLNYT